MEVVRVIIVDDHAVFREGTRRLLEQDPRLQVVAEAGSGAEAVQLTHEHLPDVLLLDLALPDFNGIEVARLVASEAPLTRIAVLSAYDDPDYIVAALKAGVAAYLPKSVPAIEVIAAIHAIVSGQVILHPAIAAKLQKSLQRQDARAAITVLTEREREVFHLAATGLHNKEIADRLSLSIRTVEVHLSHVLGKLGVSSRTEAVLYGLANGWFAADGLAVLPGDRPGTAEER
jgi:two-component system, NarL family, response regulator LiaR